MSLFPVAIRYDTMFRNFETIRYDTINEPGDTIRYDSIFRTVETMRYDAIHEPDDTTRYD